MFCLLQMQSIVLDDSNTNTRLDVIYDWIFSDLDHIQCHLLLTYFI